jgi:hypothetical protein
MQQKNAYFMLPKLLSELMGQGTRRFITETQILGMSTPSVYP